MCVWPLRTCVADVSVFQSRAHASCDAQPMSSGVQGDTYSSFARCAHGICSCCWLAAHLPHRGGRASKSFWFLEFFHQHELLGAFSISNSDSGWPTMGGRPQESIDLTNLQLDKNMCSPIYRFFCVHICIHCVQWHATTSVMGHCHVAISAFTIVCVHGTLVFLCS